MLAWLQIKIFNNFINLLYSSISSYKVFARIATYHFNLMFFDKVEYVGSVMLFSALDLRCLILFRDSWKVVFELEVVILLKILFSFQNRFINIAFLQYVASSKVFGDCFYPWWFSWKKGRNSIYLAKKSRILIFIWYSF